MISLKRAIETKDTSKHYVKVDKVFFLEKGSKRGMEILIETNF